MTNYKQIKEIEKIEAIQLADNDEIAEEIKKLKECHRQLNGITIGYHTPAGANWAYVIEIISYNGRIYKTVQVFGRIQHAAYMSIMNYEDAK